MIDKKEDYRYVSKKSLGRISVASKPYPTRDQKLVTLAVDNAFLRESVQERWDMLTPNSEREKIDTPRIVDRDIDRTIFGTSNAGNGFDGVKYLVREKGFYDKELLEQGKIGWPSELPTMVCDRALKDGVITEEDKEKDEEAQRRIDNAFDEYSKKKSELERECLEKSKALKKKLDEEDKEEYAKLVDRQQAEYERREKEVEEDKKRHGTETARIKKENAENERSILDRISKEEDLEKKAELQVEYKKCVVEGKKRLEKCEIDYSNESEKKLEKHEATLHNLKYEYDEDYRVRHNVCDDEISGLEKKRDDGIAEALEAYGDVCYEVCKSRAWDPVAYGTMPPLRKYEAGVKKANVSKSTAEKFYSRTTTFDMAETPLNRIFADLEHMTAFGQLNVHNEGLGQLHIRPAEMKYADGYVFYGEWSPFMTPFGNGYTLQRFDTKYPTKFGVYYGGRYCSDVISKICVDLLVRMFVEYTVGNGSKILPYDAAWSKNTRYAAGTMIYYKGKIERWSMMTDLITKESRWTKLGEDDIEIRFEAEDDFTSGSTIGIYVVKPPPGGEYHSGYNIGPCTIKKLKEVRSTERNYISYSMQRVELSKSETDTSMVDAIDRCYDKYVSDCEDISEGYDTRISALEKEYAKELEEKEKEHLEKTEGIDEEYSKSLSNANAEFIEKTCGVSDGVNERILKAEGKKKSEILDEWNISVLIPAENEKIEKERSAMKKWDEERASENERYMEARKAVEKSYGKKIGKLKEEKEEKLSERYRKYDYDSKGEYVLVSGYVKEKKDIIKSYRDDPLETARKKYSDSADEAYKAASEKIEQAFLKFKEDVDGLGLPMKEYSVPLTDEEKAFLEVYDREHSTNYYTSYIAIQNRWWNERDEIFKERDESLLRYRKEEWESMLKVSGVGQDARQLWEGEVEIPEDTSSPPQGEGSVNKKLYCHVVACNVWVMSKPRTLTGANFEKYYKELEEE